MKMKLVLLIFLVSVSLTVATKDIRRTQIPEFIYIGCCKVDTGWPLVVKSDYTSVGKSEYNSKNLALNFMFYLLVSTIAAGMMYKAIRVSRR